ncbi:hypothetical protein C8J23_15524 [Shewanella chilikensis]|uniref:Uncharacterized protein n=1 Tax=Shewanella chilikensis TaxID=558541 RepID=A0ABX5PHR9_9GAMM|nr:hypothetical protein C8J23_15524 [Shewanella chilikensis]
MTSLQTIFLASPVKSWPRFLALTLFVFWFNTDNAYNATTLDDLAVTADLLHGSSNFHFITP